MKGVYSHLTVPSKARSPIRKREKSEEFCAPGSQNVSRWCSPTKPSGLLDLLLGSDRLGEAPVINIPK
jgi:hypothetical protein